MGLNICVFGFEEGLRPLDGDSSRCHQESATAVIAFRRISFCVFIRQHTTLHLQGSSGIHIILRSNQDKAILLPIESPAFTRSRIFLYHFLLSSSFHPNVALFPGFVILSILAGGGPLRKAYQARPLRSLRQGPCLLPCRQGREHWHQGASCSEWRYKGRNEGCPYALYFVRNDGHTIPVPQTRIPSFCLPTDTTGDFKPKSV